ncbi:hypothetical protein MTR67_022906, partial [Solanum verrucosum]
IKVVVAIFSTTSVVICCDPLLQQGVVALIISSLSLISSQPNATGDSIMRSPMEKPFDSFRIMLKQKDEAYVATDGLSVHADAPYVAIDASFVAIFDPSVTTCDPNVATCDTNIATDAHMLQHMTPYVATSHPNIPIHDLFL